MLPNSSNTCVWSGAAALPRPSAAPPESRMKHVGRRHLQFSKALLELAYSPGMPPKRPRQIGMVVPPPSRRNKRCRGCSDEDPGTAQSMPSDVGCKFDVKAETASTGSETGSDPLMQANEGGASDTDTSSATGPMKAETASETDSEAAMTVNGNETGMYLRTCTVEELDAELDALWLRLHYLDQDAD